MLRHHALTVAITLVAAVGVSTAVAVGADDASAAPDVCLSVRLSDLPDRDAWPAIIDAVDAATATEARPQLFARRSREVLLGDGDAPGIIAIWAQDRPATASDTASECTLEAAAWSARIGRTFLAEGADRMLAVAPTTPGIASNVEVEWYPDEQRVRTWLEFEGPLSIPNGTCWIDDILSVEDGEALATTDTGLRTSPFAESACGRFFDYLTRGGAGEQAVTLLPNEIGLSDDRVLVLVPTGVTVEADAIRLSGRIEVR